MEEKIKKSWLSLRLTQWAGPGPAERQEASAAIGVRAHVQYCCSQQLAVAVTVSKGGKSPMGLAHQSFPPLSLRLMG